MPTDLYEAPLVWGNLFGRGAPDIVFRFHDDFQSLVYPFRRHVIGIK